MLLIVALCSTGIMTHIGTLENFSGHDKNHPFKNHLRGEHFYAEGK